MALFFQGTKPAVEWDAKRNRAKFQFVRRFLDTKDSKLIRLLTNLGYEQIEDDNSNDPRTRLGNIKGTSTAAPPSVTVKDQSPVSRVRRRTPPKE